MDDKKIKIIEIIQKLLIHAEDQEGTPEGEAFKRKAAVMMTKHRIEESELDLEEDNFVYDVFEFYRDSRIYPQWVGNLVAIFCDSFDCKSVVWTDKGAKKKVWEIIGSFHDTETVLYFVDVVSTHIDNAAKRKFPAPGDYAKRNQLGNVAMQIVWNRLHELKAQMDEVVQDDANAMALIVSKKNEVAEAFNELYPDIKTAKHSKLDMPKDRETAMAGIEAGETAPLNFAITEGEE